MDKLQPKAKPDVLWDTDLAGFGVKITPKGKKSYLLQYRVRGISRTYKIGDHGPITPEEARREATGLLGRVARGEDPSEERQNAKAVPTMAEAVERFLEEHVASKNKPRTYSEYKRLADKIIIPRLGRLRVDAVLRSHIAKLHQEMKETIYQANKTVAVLSAMFNWLEQVGLRPDRSNPCIHIQDYPEAKRECLLSEFDIARLGQAITDAEKDGRASLHVAAAIRLLILTGCRLNEILSLRWDEVDLDGRALRLADAKNIKVTSKVGIKKVVPLNPPAMEILARLPHVEGNPHVIVGKVEGHAMVNINKAWRSIKAKAELPNLRIHDLRHAFASVGAAMGMSLPVIGKLLGHTQPQTTARYAHLSIDPLQKATDMIGEYYNVAMNGNISLDNVTPIRKSNG
ncbi:MAG: tyrosine-type recombinase/integrase [Magnetococcales bacterium]|nr:tyrosine-type recombinase/integrase [Magnetococcales bacterium]